MPTIQKLPTVITKTNTSISTTIKLTLNKVYNINTLTSNKLNSLLVIYPYADHQLITINVLIY